MIIHLSHVLWDFKYLSIPTRSLLERLKAERNRKGIEGRSYCSYLTMPGCQDDRQQVQQSKGRYMNTPTRYSEQTTNIQSDLKMSSRLDSEFTYISLYDEKRNKGPPVPCRASIQGYNNYSSRAVDDFHRILEYSSYTLHPNSNNAQPNLPTATTTTFSATTTIKNAIKVGGSALPIKKMFRWKVIERLLVLLLLIGTVHLWYTTKEATLAYQVRLKGQFRVKIDDEESPQTGTIDAMINKQPDNRPIIVEKSHRQKTEAAMTVQATTQQPKDYPGSPLKWLPDIKIKEKELKENLTLVTAYINIGTFMNDDHKAFYKPEMYHEWMTIFSRIENPVVAYMNDNKDIEVFKRIRANMTSAPTKIVKVDKTKLWAWQMREDIKNVYMAPKYPKHSPNTYVPDYTCVMHAKYELTAKTIKENPFKTKYMAWIDIGYFRFLTVSEKNGTNFMLHLPPNFDESRVSYGEVFSYLEHTADEIFKKNRVWVTGALFLSKVTTLSKWIQDYVRYTEKYLGQGLSNTDQQVIYSMYSHIDDLTVHIQTHSWAGNYDPWFNLGFVCREQGERLKRLLKGLPILDGSIVVEGKESPNILI